MDQRERIITISVSGLLRDPNPKISHAQLSLQQSLQVAHTHKVRP